jgi:dienelactone hydrolase
LTLALSFAAPASAGQDPPNAPRVFTASDFPTLARGIAVPADGEYSVFVWAPNGQAWSVEAEGQTLTLSLDEKEASGRPAWRKIGAARLAAGSPVVIRPKPPAEEPGTKEASKGASKPSPVPALLGLAADPEADFGPSLDLARGRLDATSPPADPRRTGVRTNQQGANFRAPATTREWRDRAAHVREQLLVTLGLWPMPPRSPLDAKVYGKLERDGYTIEKVVLETLPGFTLSGNLYRPTGKAGELPAILCPHGHWEDGRMNPEVQMRCIRWAKLGCVVFMYDMVGYNDSKPFGHAFLNPRLDRWGYSLASLQTWNSIRALDWLTSLADVDPARIGCTGESGGGTQTFLLTAIDDRIKVAAPVVMVSEGFQGGCVCENAAGLRHSTDNVEFAALTAPRPLKLVGATGDWTVNTTSKIFPTLRSVYDLVGAPDRISADVFTAPHNYNQTSRNAVYAFMAHWLLGIDDPEATREGDQSPEKPEDLATFDEEHPAPSWRKTPEQLEADLVAMLGRQLDRLAPGMDSADWQAARPFLATAHATRVGVEVPPPASLKSADVRHADRGRLTIVHSTVGGPAGEQIPVVRLTPPNATGRLTVVMHPRGKAGLADAGGEPIPLVRALLERGQSVVGFDPLFVGESVDPASPAESRPDTLHYETYNKSLAADRMQDLATVVAWAGSRPDVRETSLVGVGECGPLVLLARPVLGSLARTACDLDGFDYGDGSGEVSPGLHLPGVLQFGGLKAAAALSSPAPLWIFRAPETFDAAWPENAYRLADSSSQLKIDREDVAADRLARWIDAGERDEAE